MINFKSEDCSVVVEIPKEQADLIGTVEISGYSPIDLGTSTNTPTVIRELVRFSYVADTKLDELHMK